MKSYFSFFCGILPLSGIAAPPAAPSKTAPSQLKTQRSKNVFVTLNTAQGILRVELYKETAPKTVENFLDYAQKGFYNGTVFHRIIPGFVIQGGGYDKELKLKTTNKPIQNESHNGITNTLGTLSMARTSDPHSATSQFFINLADNAFLNPSSGQQGYAVFGKVVEGMDIVQKIAKTKVGRVQGMADVPLNRESVAILSISIETTAAK
jgi:peptidyl-prolyl cis-trans isomerase A (cyclophilin A)